MTKIIYPKLSYLITGLCFKTQKELGRFCRERQYADHLEKLLKESKIKHQREYEIKKMNPESPKGNRIDFLIEKNKIIVELKAKRLFTIEDYDQLQRYLREANLQLGLIVNFGNIYLKPKRILDFLHN